MMAHESADRPAFRSVRAHRRDLPNRVDVNDHCRLGEAHAHGRDEALAAGKDLRVLVIRLERIERLGNRNRANVAEGCRLHPWRSP
ncbi:MAG: hypothetical protein M0T79_04725 [Actinomycetota bacterium]|nr:hypothetical protein [Actinomycetota bacterium]